MDNYNRPKRFELSNPAYFNDGGWGQTNSHLSKTGARVFNKLLCDEIRKHFITFGSQGGHQPIIKDER